MSLTARKQAIRTLLVGAIMSALPPTSVALAQSPAAPATILDVQGPVNVRANEHVAFHAGHAGEHLFVGSEISTGARGFAHLAWRNGGDFRLLPESDLVIPQDEGVRVNAGKVWAQFEYKLLVPFFFQAPSATAVVRGTVLGVEVAPQGATRVAVLEGKVEVSGAAGGSHLMLTPGQSINITPFGQMGPIEPVRPADHQFDRRGGPIRDHGPDRAGERDHGPDHLAGQGPERMGDHGPDHPGGQRSARMPGPGPDRGGPGGPSHLDGHDGPETNAGPARGPLDWLQRNRAIFHLEDVRAEARDRQRGPQEMALPPRSYQGRPPMPARPDVDDPPHDASHAVSPDRAFPAGRPPGDDPHDRLDPHMRVNCAPLTGLPVAPGQPGVPPGAAVCAPDGTTGRDGDGGRPH